MVGGILLMAGVGWFAELVASIVLFSAAAWIVAMIVLVILIVMYAKTLGQTVARGDWPHVTDLVLAPILASFLGFLVAKANPIDLKHAHGATEFLAAVFGIYGFWVAPFLAPILVMDDERPKRLLAYPSFFLLAYAWVSVIVVYKVGL